MTRYRDITNLGAEDDEQPAVREHRERRGRREDTELLDLARLARAEPGRGEGEVADTFSPAHFFTGCPV